MKNNVLATTHSRLLNFSKQIRVNPVLAVLSAIFIYFLSQVIAVNIIAIFGALQGWSVGRIEHWLSVNVGAIFALRVAVVVVGLVLVYGCLRLFKMSWKSVGLVRPKTSDLFVALIGFGWYILLHFGAVFLITLITPSVDFERTQQLGFSTGATGSTLLIIFISLVVLPPLYEEILMRGYLFAGLRSRLSLVATSIIVSSLFALAHLEWGGSAPLLWAAGIDTFVLSIVLVYLRERTGSLWPPIFLHAIKNGVAFVLLFIFKVQ